ncbi:MAG: TonB-dependent receptor [Chitinophagaceae bacterium]|nr:TonB-dependent receptor [Oligoflexus sp.]
MKDIMPAPSLRSCGLPLSLGFSIFLSSLALAAEPEKISVIGSRVYGRTADQSAASIETFDEETINRVGQSELGKVLQELAPSFNFSATTVSDGSDSVRPATLKGMGPDQVLVLINGKRRHNQALLNVQQTVGRGSAGTDINAIPLAAVKRVEILKEGAAAQYGSDAIAGVINIVLKDNLSPNDTSLYLAKNFAGDGDTGQLGTSYGFAPAAGGFFRISGEALKRNETNRALTDTRFNKRTMHIGESEAQDESVFLNTEYPLTSKVNWYLFGGLSQRNSESGGFFREPDSDRNLATVYPAGFNPKLATTIKDRSMSTGIKSPLGDDWDMDLSYTYGANAFNFSSRDSVNVSLGQASPHNTDDGTLESSDGITNLDLRGSLDLGWSDPLHIAAGVAYRTERYQILPGEFASWTYGPNNDFSQTILGQNGQLAPAGIQGFPGFQPANAVDATRTSYAIFIDLESYLTKQFLAALSARYEDYEQVGASTTGKMSLRYDFVAEFALRSTISSGFRAPSLAQVNYSSRSTTFAGNQLTETQTARQGSLAFKSLGLRDLKTEKSLNESFGFLAHPLPNMSVSADYYKINVSDRIVLSEFLQAEPKAGCAADNSNCPIRQVLEPINIDAVQFFTNAIDTTTRGLDFVMDYNLNLGTGRRMMFLGSYSYNRTHIETIHNPQGVASGVVFSEAQSVLMEEGQPRQRIQIGSDYFAPKWKTGVRFNYYGDVSGAGFGGYKQTYKGKWLTDVNYGYNLTETLRLDVGAQNLFDIYPDRMKPDHPVRAYAGGSFKYSWETAPFGYKGGLYYSRLNWNF